MTIDEVNLHFGSLSKACRALGITTPNITKWKQQGYIPLKQQFKLAMITEGELMPDETDPHVIVHKPKKKYPRKPKSKDNQ